MYKGEKVLLREYRKEDIPVVQKYINDSEIKKLLIEAIPYPITLLEEEKWYEKQTAFSDEYNFAIESIEEGKYIGGCGTKNVDWKNSRVEVGIFIGDKNYLGKGYGTDAMKTLVRFIFSEMNINKIKLNVYSFNDRAIKSYKKCGFKIEGTLKQEMFRGGKYHDEYIMAILREEYLG